MRFGFILILAFTYLFSCNSAREIDDKEWLLEYYKNASYTDSILINELENSVLLVDEVGDLIEMHSFNKQNKLMIYRFYSKYIDTEFAIFGVDFDSIGSPTLIKGAPFYFSTSLLDSLYVDSSKVKVLIYIANSPFIKPHITLSNTNQINGEVSKIEIAKPDFLIYYEDSLHSEEVLMEYKIRYETTALGTKNFVDSIIFEKSM